MLGNEQLTTLMVVARKVFNSGFIPKDCGSEDAVFAMMLMGAELGFEPMQSLAAVHSIKGKLSLRADAMVALCMRSPVCKHFVLVESTDKIATYEALREGHPAPTRLSYRIEQAQRAGLLSNPQWKNHPEAMLRARCSGALARLVFPDLAAGIYVPDEAEEIAANDNAPRAAAPRQLPAEPAAQLPAPTEPPALAAYRARVAACVTSDELVAVRLALRSSLSVCNAAEIEEARALTATRAKDLFGNLDDFTAAVQNAEKVTKEPAHWTVVATVLGGLAHAATEADTKALVASAAKSTSALPDALKGKLSAALRARRAALAAPPATDAAAAIEEALRAADGIPALDDIYDRITAAATEGKVTRDQAGKLVELYNARVAEMEREPATEDAA